jgi:hypothetical protein
MPICDYCGMAFDLCEGIYDAGDFICGNCIAGLIIQSETVAKKSREQLKSQNSGKAKKQKKCKSISSLHSSQTSKKQNTSKPNKAERLANHIQIMSKRGGVLCINPSNEKAFELAVEKLGMRLNEFCIEFDDGYLHIRLKRDIQKQSQILPLVPPLLKRPELPIGLRQKVT